MGNPNAQSPSELRWRLRVEVRHTCRFENIIDSRTPLDLIDSRRYRGLVRSLLGYAHARQTGDYTHLSPLTPRHFPPAAGSQLSLCLQRVGQTLSGRRPGVGTCRNEWGQLLLDGGIRRLWRRPSVP